MSAVIANGHIQGPRYKQLGPLEVLSRAALPQSTQVQEIERINQQIYATQNKIFDLNFKNTGNKVELEGVKKVSEHCAESQKFKITLIQFHNWAKGKIDEYYKTEDIKTKKNIIATVFSERKTSLEHAMKAASANRETIRRFTIKTISHAECEDQLANNRAEEAFYNEASFLCSKLIFKFLSDLPIVARVYSVDPNQCNPAVLEANRDKLTRSIEENDNKLKVYGQHLQNQQASLSRMTATTKQLSTFKQMNGHHSAAQK